MLKLLVLLLLVNCVFPEEAKIKSEKCKEMFEPHSENVFDCCDTPRLETSKCESVCKDQTDYNCSCLNCLNKNDYVLKEKDQFLKLYDQNLNEKFAANEKRDWLPVINKSFKHCKPLFDILNGTDECQLPKYYRPMVSCMKQQNFINCPRSFFAPSKTCNATRKFINEQETCGTKYEEIFVIDHYILDQSADQENKCEKKFKDANLNSKMCVYVPELFPPSNVFNGCLMQCTTSCTKTECLWSECCMAPCELNVTSVEDFGEKVVKDKINEFTKFYRKVPGFSFDIWKPIVESSFGICNLLASKVIGSKRCNIKLKFNSLRSCMRQEMFLNAPTTLINDPDQFEKIKTFIANETKCGKKFGEKFIIDGSFWEY